MMILGGVDDSGNPSKVVEEIDFIKRNIVNLASMNHARANSSAFIVNDSIYVFGGSSSPNALAEKYTLSENRWREIMPKALKTSELSKRPIGAAALLYE